MEKSQSAIQLKALRKRTPLTVREVAKQLGKPASSYSFYEDEYKKQHLPFELVRALMPIFEPYGITQAELLHLAGIFPGEAPPHEGRSVPRQAQEPRQSVSPYDSGDPLPVLGVAEGGPDGLLDWNGDIIGQIPRPAYLAGARSAYALYVTGTSMVPRYHQGELIHVHPGKPITPDCFVVVQFHKDGVNPTPAAVVKQFVRRDERNLVLRQLNPAKEYKIPAGQVRSVHRIVGSSES
jgi:Predicted transcriptional regulator